MVDVESVTVRLERLDELRNILVHGYLDVDDQAVWSALDRLDDLRSFVAAVRTIIETDRSSTN